MRTEVFCEKCEKYVPFTEKKRNAVHKLRGERVKFLETIGICGVCGGRVGYMLYNDQNLDALYKAYKGKNKIIETEEIKEILDMYAVGKRPLSLLLGWGELTITRYIEGYVPTKPYSDVLKKVREDADYYMSVIESNKSLVAQPAYEKSMEAAKKIAKTQNENRANGKMVKKTLQIPEWMAKRAETAGLNLSAVLQDAIKAAL